MARRTRSRRSKSAKKTSPKRRARRSTKRASRKKVVNKWISHVKKEAKKLKLNYAQALSDPRVKASYKRASK